jgi:enoyl-CoA hydratase
MSITYSILRFENLGHTGIVYINRPEALNALNTLFFKEMDDLLDQIALEKELRALIITGEGKAFAAGADIAEMVHMDKDAGTAFSGIGQDVFSKIESLKIPVIAAINGFALGGGMELALACDIRIASAKAKFGQPEVNLGLIPGYGATQRLPRLIGMANALYLLITAEVIDANEALRLGIIQRVTEPDQLIPAAIALAGLIASKGSQSVTKIKEVTHTGFSMTQHDGMLLEREQFGRLFGNGSESEEGMKAFLEKRKPNW